MMIDELSIAEIKKRYEALAPSLLRTPTIQIVNERLLKRIGAGALFLKLECLQHAGSFKARGAYSSSSQQIASKGRKGLTCASSGNHATAVAWAAGRLGVTAKVVMYNTSNPLRVARARGFGAEVIQRLTGQEVFAEAERLVADEDRIFIHPFEGVDISLGTAGVGLEMMQDVPDLDILIVAIGGGGLISGIAPVVKQINPRCAVIGVEPKGADAVSRGLQAGSPVTLDTVNTIADSLAPPMSLPFSLQVIREFADEVVVVDDDDICKAMVLMQQYATLAVEPAAAAPLAAALGPLHGRVNGKRVGFVVCGTNIDNKTYGDLIMRGRDLMAAELS